MCTTTGLIIIKIHGLTSNHWMRYWLEFETTDRLVLETFKRTNMDHTRSIGITVSGLICESNVVLIINQSRVPTAVPSICGTQRTMLTTRYDIYSILVVVWSECNWCTDHNSSVSVTQGRVNVSLLFPGHIFVFGPNISARADIFLFLEICESLNIYFLNISNILMVLKGKQYFYYLQDRRLPLRFT